VPYLEALPDDLSGQPVYLVDPMLATGGSLVHAIELLTARGADDITVICRCLGAAGCGSSRGDGGAAAADHGGGGPGAERGRVHRAGFG